MSDFTIEQLEALKEGTTPGPWEWSDHRVPDLTNGGLWPIVLEADHDGGRMGDCTLELHIKDEDKRLIAAASALVDALIAEKREHHKLRVEIWDALNGEGKHFNEIAKNSRILHTYNEISREAIKRILEATGE